jgi:phenylpropionate dioxygenase-like ring-hydroxylating dioxygenase large terminal subunit
MFISQTHLPHLLSPNQYTSQAQHDFELERLFLPAWHFVGTTHDLASNGDYLTLDLHGRPLLVRNCEGTPRTFLNACPHRHAKLTSEPAGNCAMLRCQYHGWEFDDQGDTKRIPDAKSFRPLARGMLGLRQYRTEACGPLVFTTFDDGAPSLAEYLGPAWDLIRTNLTDDFTQAWSAERNCGANWKIAVENSLESYHIACVHPKTFGAPPAAEACHHELGDTWSAFHTNSKDDRSLRHWQEAIIMWLICGRATYDYTHMHVFPALLLAPTDAGFIVQSVVPESPTSHRSLWRFFAHRGTKWNPVARTTAWFFKHWAVGFTERVVGEDLSILSSVQRGMNSPERPHGGLISVREERIFQFQRYVHDRCHGAPHTASSKAIDSVACTCADAPASIE